MTPRLWIVVPVYFDVPSFSILRAAIAGALDAHDEWRALPVTLVVADDSGGLDPAIGGLEQGQDLIVIEPPFNLGHQRAIVYALRKVAPQMRDEDIVVTMDADGEDDPRDVPRLLEQLQRAGSKQAVALAVRTHRQESPMFKVFYRIFRLAFRALTGTVVRSGNFAAYHGWVARRVLAHPNFDLCYSSTLTSLDLAIATVPCARARRYQGESRMTFAKLVRHGVSMLMPYLDQIATRALLVFSGVIAVGVALGLIVLGVSLGTDAAIPDWATAAVLALLISSLVALGNFVVLFAVYSQSRGLSLADLEQRDQGSTEDAGSSSPLAQG